MAKRIKKKRYEENQENKKDIKKTIVSSVIAFIMISSVFGVMFYGFNSGSTVERYNDIVFRSTELGYQTKVEGEKYYFDYLPQETEGINISNSVVSLIKNAEGMITTSDRDSIYSEEISLASYKINTAAEKMGKFSYNAFKYTGKNITCDNSTSLYPVVEISYKNQTRIYKNESCILIDFERGSELSLATSRIIYEMLGIIE